MIITGLIIMMSFICLHYDIEFDGNNGEGNENENNISIQSDKKYIDRCFFDDDVSHI